VLSQRDPVWRASEIAAKLNQLNRDGVDARTITVSWESRPGDSGYVIKAGDQVLALMDSNTILPDTTRNPETDALQATNRLRRLLGNAEPLSEVTGKPRRQTQVSVGPFHIALSGMASWYGPGFHGNQSASGEIFNEHKMTAAHRSLPFGTQVRVTNLDNGLSVIVRINDRGPFHGNRIIDLSTAAARVLGLIQTGVAPVRLDVITPHSVAEN
jgi:rare lipoprotein A